MATACSRQCPGRVRFLGFRRDVPALLAASDLLDCGLKGGRCLSLAALAALSPARQRNLLRYWLAGNALPLPSLRR